MNITIKFNIFELDYNPEKNYLNKVKIPSSIREE